MSRAAGRDRGDAGPTRIGVRAVVRAFGGNNGSSPPKIEGMFKDSTGLGQRLFSSLLPGTAAAASGGVASERGPESVAPDTDPAVPDEPATPQARPTQATATDARRRFALDAGAQYRVRLLDDRLRAGVEVLEGAEPRAEAPTKSARRGSTSRARPDSRPAGPSAPLAPGSGGEGAPGLPWFSEPTLGWASRARARAALAVEPAPDPAHPYVAHQQAMREDLDKLGLLRPGSARLFVIDVVPDHGEAVLRTAAGKTSLISNADASLDLAEAPMALLDKHLTPERKARFLGAQNGLASAERSGAGLDVMVERSVDALEATVIAQRLQVARVRGELPSPPDGKKTLVNMSWGLDPDGAATRIATRMLASKADSPLGAEARKILGHEPTLTSTEGGFTQVDKGEVERLKREVIYPKLERALARPEPRARMETARAELAEELAAGRKQGMLVFVSAGNNHQDAAEAGRPELSTSPEAGTPGLIRVGGVDLRGPGAADDAIYAASAAGNVQLSAPGVDIPVGLNSSHGIGMFGLPVGGSDAGSGRPTDLAGTSFASPYVAQVAYLMDAANPRLSADDLARLLTDPRAVNDIAGTDRDGAGAIDPFAAVLLAKNPALSRAEIDSARALLRQPGTDAAALAARLGLR